MYMPLPGYSHVKLLAPIDRITYAHRASLVDSRTMVKLRDIVMFVVEVAARRRNLTRFDEERFDPSIYLHLRAWLRTADPSIAACDILSIHAQPSGEFHGSALIGNRRHAFTGTFDGTRLGSFRLLAPHGSGDAAEKADKC